MDFDLEDLHRFFSQFEVVVLIYFFAVNGFYTLLLVMARLEMSSHLREGWGEPRWKVLGSEIAPRITMLAPAFNEEATIAQSLRAFLSHYYPSLEVVVVSDGSKDKTMDVLISEFDLVPVEAIYRKTIETGALKALYRSKVFANLVVIDKVNGGKADALNLGLQLASGELICAMDADTLVEPDALQKIVRPFLTDESVVAVGGTIRVVNECTVEEGHLKFVRAPRTALAGFQTVEYLRAFLLGRLGWNRLGGNLIISGAFGLFDKEAVLKAGGYLHETVGEDMELVVRLMRTSREEGKPRRVAFVPDPVAWTEVPESTRILSRQRDRWHRGLADVLWRHRKMFMNPRYGIMGVFSVPSFWLIELAAPIVEALGLVGLVVGILCGAINLPFAVLFFLTAYGYGVLLSIACILLDELSFHRYQNFSDSLVLIGWALLENLGYRQMTVYWRLQGLVKFMKGNRAWGVMERKGFAGAKKPGA